MTVGITITTHHHYRCNITTLANCIISITVIAAGNYSSSIYEDICDSLFLL